MIREIELERCKDCGIEISDELSGEETGRCLACDWKHNAKPTGSKEQMMKIHYQILSTTEATFRGSILLCGKVIEISNTECYSLNFVKVTCIACRVFAELIVEDA